MHRIASFGLLLVACLFGAAAGRADEPKNHDRDLIYDEARVPAYDLPPILVSSEGRRITTPDEWFQVRRPQIMSLFGNLIYGVVPSPESPIRTTFEVVRIDREFMGGRAVRKDVRIRFENAKGSAELLILVFSPARADHPVPAILLHSFAGTRDDGHDAHPDRPGHLRNGLPLGEMLQRGFGFVVVPQGDLVRHNEVEFLKGIHPLFYRTGQSFPKANEWGVISAIAWGASRAMDYLETDKEIDARRVAIMGHSKCGKAALWTAAQDQRFALVISAQSGHPGAALSRRKSGETLEKMVTRFPYWLCRNAWKFVNNEDDLPVDQHMLLACIAPRPLYVMSGDDDKWADPRGEYLSAYHASEVYRLLGRTGLESEKSPPVGEAILQSDVGYHNRAGGHSIETYDWMKFLEFAANKLPKPATAGEMSGYLIVPNEKVPESYNAGFSMYVAAWPLLKEYPGHQFQTGLFGTWMFAQYAGVAPTNMYSDIEGGLGWWRDTRFATETPKFIMGGVAPNFSEWANGPGAGQGRDWDQPKGKYGVAQLSPWLLWPPDGLNLKQGTCGELFGYGYLPLPLTSPKPSTAGKDIPTGDQSWTLFLNTRNFKGPVAFFTPYFWSHTAVTEPRLAGLLLDSRPSQPNRALQMETQYVPSIEATDRKGETYARIAETSFPRGPEGESPVVHRVTSYNKQALWDSVKAWFEGGPEAAGTVNPAGAVLHAFGAGGRATWRIYTPEVPQKQRVPIAWNSIATPVTLNPTTFGYRWNKEKVSSKESQSGPLITLPEYYHLVTNSTGKAEWIPVRPEEVPTETGLVQARMARPQEEPQEAYVTPDDPMSCWKKPGAAAGPFQARLGDGSVVTYSWYRFADQPAVLNADLTDQERENLQARVEKLHRLWTKDREYLPPPTVGKLAELDPALVLTPPKGFEVGYVPIATRQEAAR